MHISIVAVGTRMPQWIQQGCADYLQRLPREWSVQLTEVAPARLGKQAPRASILRAEGERIRAQLRPNSASALRHVALDVKGKAWSTAELARQLQVWQLDGRDVAILIGGPEGLDESLLGQAEQRWSLSPLTFPHPLVRVILLEQLYRAWSILQNHPYHRE
ncbi:MAG: 23S rRNA (pseudouridine(1915)-N(3))-methyltransferase RlmH [Candidatus Competibacteraceae bacterium]|nr:23S rRNA (pseudouridine(1915)-N(3))-methyltransferase RlmH [Candidatus Competibacteraceae bacterium]MCB1813327.1 23S rRNA (pseudouridine(1915)-N(3))-methyltransferase RlmH [Candidatus Competibacteraceae bacterium]